MTTIGRLMLIAMAVGPVCAYAQTPGSGNDTRHDSERRQDAGAVISADIKGFGRDEAWREGAWQPRRGDQHPIATATPTEAPELGLGFAACSLVLCIGGLAVVRGRRTPKLTTPELS
jgi:hypothetical protein